MRGLHINIDRKSDEWREARGALARLVAADPIGAPQAAYRLELNEVLRELLGGDAAYISDEIVRRLALLLDSAASYLHAAVLALVMYANDEGDEGGRPIDEQDALAVLERAIDQLGDASPPTSG